MRRRPPATRAAPLEPRVSAVPVAAEPVVRPRPVVRALAAALAYAAIDADVFPVDTHATRVIPNATACEAPQVIPLSLNDPVGLNP